MKFENEKIIGRKLLQMNETYINDLSERIKTIISIDSKSQLKAKMPAYLIIEEYITQIIEIATDSKLTVTIECNEEKNVIELVSQSKDQFFSEFDIIPREFSKYIDNYRIFSSRLPINETVHFTSNLGAMFCYERLAKKNVLYVQYNFVRNFTQTVEEFTAELKDTIDSSSIEKIVFDIRTNPGGESTFPDILIDYSSEDYFNNTYPVLTYVFDY